MLFMYPYCSLFQQIFRKQLLWKLNQAERAPQQARRHRPDVTFDRRRWGWRQFFFKSHTYARSRRRSVGVWAEFRSYVGNSGDDGGPENARTTKHHLWVSADFLPNISRLLLGIPSIPDGGRTKIPSWSAFGLVRKFLKINSGHLW